MYIYYNLPVSCVTTSGATKLFFSLSFFLVCYFYCFFWRNLPRTHGKKLQISAESIQLTFYFNFLCFFFLHNFEEWILRTFYLLLLILHHRNKVSNSFYTSIFWFVLLLSFTSLFTFISFFTFYTEWSHKKSVRLYCKFFFVSLKFARQYIMNAETRCLHDCIWR